MKRPDMEEMARLGAACMELECRERPEIIWLKERYRRFMRREGFSSKEAADKCIYRRMYGREPSKKEDILKIRYWRTGHHLPVSHEQCTAFGRALELDKEEMQYLLQGYYDSCDMIHEEEPPDGQSAYWKRRRAMDRLVERYLRGIPQDRLEQMRITSGSLNHSVRHLYYTDALRYVQSGRVEQRDLERHITSINYDSELGRNMKLLGVIPRMTMIRHLIILGMPYISLEWMNRQLKAFGYLELQEQHTLRGGERLDWLLIRLLERYEACCREWPIQECCQWLQQSCSCLDVFFEQMGKRRLRFMYFKALKE